MSYNAVVLADSVGPHGIRLVTFEATYPRFVHAELLTHRALSRNSASNRAIPTEKQIDEVVNNPFIPMFNKRVKGMGVGELLSEEEQCKARMAWERAMEACISAARDLLHVDKSRANRLLEPFQWITSIISATELENFLNLRDHGDAQPEIIELAASMRKARDTSTPKRLEYGDWHLPLWFKEDEDHGEFIEPAKVSAGRCARVSYDTHHKSELPQKSQDRWDKLAGGAHWSPSEHPAQCTQETTGLGNFTGWKQLRKFYPGEDIFQTD